MAKKMKKTVVDQKVLAAMKEQMAPKKESGAPHLIIQALAGTGKTTTLVEGLRMVMGQVPKFSGTEQQRDIWDALTEGEPPRSVLFAAFNASIAEELGKRMPRGCAASTIHSLGFKAVKKWERVWKPNTHKTRNLLEHVTGKDIREIWKKERDLEPLVKNLVNLCKMTLAGWDKVAGWQGPTDEELQDLVSKYDLVQSSSQWEPFLLVREILEYSRDPEKCREAGLRFDVDFSDMIWLPVVNQLSVDQYDLLLVDEAQDMNACQQQLILKAGRRIVCCGDANQAIYGFAGADTESINNLEGMLGATGRPVQVLPLTMTFRCGKNIVEEAKKIVPDYEAFEKNHDGLIGEAKFEKFLEEAEEGHMVVCRMNAPLISAAFKMIARGKLARIQGRNIGEGLISQIRALKARDVTDLMDKIEEWYHEECKKATRGKNPDEAKLIALEDKKECLLVFCEGARSIDDVVKNISNLFVDDQRKGVLLSSIHRAKGLEAERVYVLAPEKLPHPMAKSEWQQKQEMHLKYVAVTRAIQELVWVR